MVGRMLKRRGSARAGVLAACLVLTGAMAADGPGVLRSLRVWDRVEVTVSPDLHQATRLDIVLVYDIALMPHMPRSTADWFAKRAALQAAARRGLGVVSLEVAALSPEIRVKLPPGAGKAAGAFVYADLPPGQGAPAAALAPHRCVHILLGQQLAQQPC